MPPSAKLKIVYLSLDQIKPNSKNPREIEEAIEPVSKSIEEFGFLQPITINSDNTILTGHVRYEAAKLLGMEQIPVIYAKNLNDYQQNAFMVADNKLSEKANFDKAKLKKIFQELEAVTFDALATGFSREEIDQLLESAELDVEEVEGLFDEATETAKETEDELREPLSKINLDCTKEQSRVIKNAIKLIRQNSEEDLSQTEAIAAICNYYLTCMGQ